VVTQAARTSRSDWTPAYAVAVAAAFGIAFAPSVIGVPIAATSHPTLMNRTALVVVTLICAALPLVILHLGESRILSGSVVRTVSGWGLVASLVVAEVAAAGPVFLVIAYAREAPVLALAHTAQAMGFAAPFVGLAASLGLAHSRARRNQKTTWLVISVLLGVIAIAVTASVTAFDYCPACEPFG
jgi:hypothetical protein